MGQKSGWATIVRCIVSQRHNHKHNVPVRALKASGDRPGVENQAIERVALTAEDAPTPLLLMNWLEKNAASWK